MREYITSEHISDKRISSPVHFGPIGEKVYNRTYSRKKKDGSREDWYDTCARVVNGNCNFVHSQFIEKDEPQKLFDLMVGMEIIPAGRHLFATNIGNNTGYLNNCFSAAFTDKFQEHFEFTFMRLMEGGGVGANYSDLYVHSREGTPHSKGKSWSPKARKNIHLVCDDRHPDFKSFVQLQTYEDKYFQDAFWPTEDQLNQHGNTPSGSVRSWAGESSKIQTYKYNLQTGLPNEWCPITPFVTFQSILSKEYSSDWDPRSSNGIGPIYIRVEDSREGWTEALSLILNSYILDEAERDIIIDVSRVREWGAILKGFGGTASGPEALMLMVLRFSRLLNEKVGKPLTSMDYMLMDHFIAMAVVSGGTRRSARMAMKYWMDKDIFQFINCKNIEAGKVPAHWTTNISVVIDNKFLRALKRGDEHACKVYELVCQNMVEGNGEPGLINASKMLEGEPPGVQFYVSNPCAEIGMVQYYDLYCFDVCCLGQINLDRVKDPKEAFRLMTRFLIRATFAPVADERQKANVKRNRRIGVGFMGYHSWLVKNGIKYSDAPNISSVREHLRSWKKIVDEEKVTYSHQLRIPTPVKGTALAPTGTINNLAGCTSSAQCLFSKFLIRRVQYSNSDPELVVERNKGVYRIEPSRYAANTSVIEYVMVDPLYDNITELKKNELLQDGMDEAEAIILAEEYALDLIEDQQDLDVEDVLSNQRMIQKEYVDNAISMTINVDPEKYRKEKLMEVLRHYLGDLKGLTMFPEYSMPQLPLQRLTYDELLQEQTNGYPIERSQAEQQCLNGMCPIR